MEENQPSLPSNPNARKNFNLYATILKWKEHPIAVIGTFLLFIAGIYFFTESLFSNRLAEQQVLIEKLRNQNTEKDEAIQKLQKDTVAFRSLKQKIRSEDKSAVSPKERIIIDSLETANANKTEQISRLTERLSNLISQNNELSKKLSSSGKSTFSKDPVIKFVEKAVHDTVYSVDTVYSGASAEPYWHTSGTLYEGDGFQDNISGFAIGVTNFTPNSKKMDVTVILPGELGSKEYKGVTAGKSWAGSKNDTKYLLTVMAINANYDGFGNLLWSVKVSEVPK